MVCTRESVWLTNPMLAQLRIFIASILAVLLSVALPLSGHTLLSRRGGYAASEFPLPAGSTTHLVRSVTAIPFTVASPLFVDAVGRVGALELFRCAVYMAEDFVSAVLTVGVSITPSIEMKALPVVASTFFH